MYKPGDILTIFDDPIACQGNQGKATLIEFLKDYDQMERWKVEFVDSPDHFYNVFIKKTENVVDSKHFV